MTTQDVIIAVIGGFLYLYAIVRIGAPSMSKIKTGTRSVCLQCRKPIEFCGVYWRHLDKNYRHVARPDKGAMTINQSNQNGGDVNNVNAPDVFDQRKNDLPTDVRPEGPPVDAPGISEQEAKQFIAALKGLRLRPIKPTVGRVVLYHHDDFNQPLSARIAYVHSDTLINVAIDGPDGAPLVSDHYPRIHVRLVQPGESPAPSMPYCTWMPYQIGQAAKTEQLQKELTDVRRDVPPATG